MRGYIRAVLMAVATLQVELAWTQEDPRELYLQAAERIANAQYAQATHSLESLLALGRNSQLASQASLPLAECYLAERRFSDAYRLLEDGEWFSDDPDLQDRILRLKIHAARGAAWESEQAGQYLSALDWLEKNLQLQRASQLPIDQPRREYIRLAVLASQHEASSSETLTAFVNSLPAELQSSIRFAIAERMYANGNLEKAAQQYDQLAQTLVDTRPQEPEWAASVTMRRAEILIRRHDYRQASRLLQQSLKSHPNFKHNVEIHFLLARCALANIEFEEAIQHLQAVLNSAACGDNPTAQESNAKARAQWMLGEVYFLQEDYASAIAAYRSVRNFSSELWTRRALVQQAKCMELSGDRQAALDAYRQAIQMSANSPEGEFASKRVAQIDSTAAPASINLSKKR